MYYASLLHAKCNHYKKFNFNICNLCVYYSQLTLKQSIKRKDKKVYKAVGNKFLRNNSNIQMCTIHLGEICTFAGCKMNGDLTYMLKIQVQWIKYMITHHDTFDLKDQRRKCNHNEKHHDHDCTFASMDIFAFNVLQFLSKIIVHIWQLKNQFILVKIGTDTHGNQNIFKLKKLLVHMLQSLFKLHHCTYCSSDYWIANALCCVSYVLACIFLYHFGNLKKYQRVSMV